MDCLRQGVLVKWYTASRMGGLGTVQGREEAIVNEGGVVLARGGPATRRHSPARRGRPDRAAPRQARAATEPTDRFYTAVRLVVRFWLWFCFKLVDVRHPEHVPVGLTFEARTSFLGRVLVHFGEPIPVAPYLDAHREDPSKAVDALT